MIESNFWNEIEGIFECGVCGGNWSFVARRLCEFRGIGFAGKCFLDGAEPDHAGAQVAAILRIFSAAGSCSGAPRVGWVHKGAGTARFFG